MRSSSLVVFALAALSTLAAAPHPAAADRETVRADGYEVVVETSGPASAGHPVALDVTIEPRDGYKLNLEFPLRVELALPEGVTAGRTRLGRDDARRLDERGAALTTTLTSSVDGEATVLVELRFAVCSDRTCEPKRDQVTFRLRVGP